MTFDHNPLVHAHTHIFHMHMSNYAYNRLPTSSHVHAYAYRYYIYMCVIYECTWTRGLDWFMFWFGCLNSTTWQGPKFDEQGFSAKIGDELLAFKLDRPGLLGGFWGFWELSPGLCEGCIGGRMVSIPMSCKP